MWLCGQESLQSYIFLQEKKYHSKWPGNTGTFQTLKKTYACLKDIMEIYLLTDSPILLLKLDAKNQKVQNKMMIVWHHIQ